MSYEARIFFPLSPAVEEQQQSDAAGSITAPFSLFDASDFRRFHPTDAVPASQADEQAERRCDLYLIDERMEDSISYGLKLRDTGAPNDDNSSGSGSSSHVERGKQEAEYKLELKIRKKVKLADQGAGSAATGNSEGAAAAAGMPLAEKWKKVLKATSIRCTLDAQSLVGAVLPVLSHTNRTASLMCKKRTAEMTAHLVQRLRDQQTKEEGSSGSTCPLRMVAVDKRRHKLSRYNAEQTDMEVSLVEPPTGSDGGHKRARTVRHYRSICFEGSAADMESQHIRDLFRYLLQRCPGALIAGYPEFLQHVLPQL